MLSVTQNSKQSKSNCRQWVINLLIAGLTIVIMLLVGEVLFRWLDGYELLNPHLRPQQEFQEGEIR